MLKITEASHLEPDASYQVALPELARGARPARSLPVILAFSFSVQPMLMSCSRNDMSRSDGCFPMPRTEACTYLHSTDTRSAQ